MLQSMFKTVQNLPFLSQQIQILIRSLLRCRRHTDIYYPVQTFVVLWAMKSISVAYSYKLFRHESDFFMILMISSQIIDTCIRGSIFLLAISTTEYLYVQQVFSQPVPLNLNCHEITQLQNMTAYTAILCFLNFQQYLFVFHYLGLFEF